ncbi:hypothetical protein OSSY52_19970 [Tepiditoga spiralis]|uniref:Outer membrane protein beta-barrel domain-containing protein n=1 Tax=Tepiditoga spiralis TaxID=2108365 RepID=A0A7G1G8U5_9BACT|nr:hypothetical protein [Tepiditoga spiralis]BBE31856.1 hypothetical protein OSSY52_19970 [Tepiditoga spiralis]
MKKIFLFIIISFTIFNFSKIFFNYSYEVTQSATSAITNFDTNLKADYIGGRISYLVPTEDSNEIYFGPYFGFFYNNFKDTMLNLYNPKIGTISYSLGLNVVYKGKIIENINYSIIAYGGVHSEDNLVSFSTEVLVGGGLNIGIFHLSSSYETRYYKSNDDYTIINYIPVFLGVELQF